MECRVPEENRELEAAADPVDLIGDMGKGSMGGISARTLLRHISGRFGGEPGIADYLFTAFDNAPDKSALKIKLILDLFLAILRHGEEDPAGEDSEEMKKQLAQIIKTLGDTK